MRYLLHTAAIIVIPLGFAVFAWLSNSERPMPLEPYRPPEVEMMFPVDDVEDCAEGKEYDRLVQLFAPGSEPSLEAAQRYSNFHYKGRNPKQSGEKASVQVTIKDDETGKARGEFRWTMTRVERAWKLVEAPLPK